MTNIKEENKMKVIVTLDTEDNLESEMDWHGYHNKDWINKDKPTSEEIAWAMRSECISWLDDLRLNFKVEIIDEHSLVGKCTSGHWSNIL